jgi:transposase
MSAGTVCDYLGRAMRAGLSWEQAVSMSEPEVEAQLFKHIGRSEPEARAAVDFAWVHRELRRHGVTLQLLWGDYQQATQKAAARPYQYSQFCELYAEWRGQQRLSMRQTHRPGEKLFVDYSGKKAQCHGSEHRRAA